MQAYHLIEQCEFTWSGGIGDADAAAAQADIGRGEPKPDIEAYITRGETLQSRPNDRRIKNTIPSLPPRP